MTDVDSGTTFTLGLILQALEDLVKQAINRLVCSQTYHANSIKINYLLNNCAFTLLLLWCYLGSVCKGFIRSIDSVAAVFNS